jgi:hypothetical protein
MRNSNKYLPIKKVEGGEWKKTRVCFERLMELVSMLPRVVVVEWHIAVELKPTIGELSSPPPPKKRKERPRKPVSDRQCRCVVFLCVCVHMCALVVIAV